MKIRNKFFAKQLMEQAGEGGEQGGGQQAPAPTPADFLATLDQETRSRLEQNGIKDTGNLVKQFLDQQSYLGQSIRIPSEHASEEERKAFYDKIVKRVPGVVPRPNKDDQAAMEAFYAAIGRPESADAYQLTLNEEAAKLIPEDRMKLLKTAAHKAGLSADQLNAVLGEVAQADLAQHQEIQTKLLEEQTKLKNEWGSAYDQKLSQTIQIMELTGAPAELIEMAKANQMGSDALKWLNSLAGKFKAEDAQAINDISRGSLLSPSEANARLDEIYANPQHPFFVPSHPSHKSAKDEVVRLMGLANPGAVKDMSNLKASIQAI